MRHLTQSHFVGSPFQHRNLAEVLNRFALLNHLNGELAKPVNPNASEVEYVPTQYLAEVILNAGFDGIIYGSAVALKGVNVVFFRPKDLRVSREGQLVKVKGMSVEIGDP